MLQKNHSDHSLNEGLIDMISFLIINKITQGKKKSNVAKKRIKMAI